MEEDAPEVEVRSGNTIDHRPEWRNVHSQCIGWGSRQCRRQGTPWFPRDTFGGSPSSGDGSSNLGSNQHSQQSILMGVSEESKWPVQPGRDLRKKVNLPIFKDDKTKDVVTYCLWQWDVAIFCHSGWDDQHLVPYVFWSFQFDTQCKELYSIKQGSWRIWPNLGCTCCSRSRYSSQSIQEGSNRSM